VNKLWFYVKLGPLGFLWGRGVLWVGVWAILASSGCGYRSVFAGSPPDQALSVAPARSAAWPRALEAVLSGAREELAGMGVLGAGSYPELRVELTRVDEIASAISAVPLEVGGRTPLGRGSAVGVTGRAWVVEAPGGEVSRDTGDVRRSARHAMNPDVSNDATAHDAAVVSASRLLGRSLARSVLGVPEPSVEPL
jgi:hypothetical protein